MKRGLILLLVLAFLLIFSGCAVYANHNYGLAMHRDIEIRSGTAIGEVFRRFGPPDQIHQIADNTFYMFAGQSSITVANIISRIQTEAMVVVTDRNGLVTQSYFVKTGEGSTYLGSPELFIKIQP